MPLMSRPSSGTVPEGSRGASTEKHRDYGYHNDPDHWLSPPLEIPVLSQN
jgi:hypothetical protein